MNIDDFMEGIHIIQDNYNKKFTKQQLRLFYENLKDMNKDKYIANIKEHVKENPFVPNVAQLRGKYNYRDTYSNYEQRDYSDFDFSKLYANKGV